LITLDYFLFITLLLRHSPPLLPFAAIISLPVVLLLIFAIIAA